jgi:hypothetical protein
MSAMGHVGGLDVRLQCFSTAFMLISDVDPLL